MSNEKKISPTTSYLMLGTALFYDTLGFLLEATLILPSIVSVTSYVHFYIWFKMHGVTFTSKKRVSTGAVGFIIGFIPLINALPELTLSVWLIIQDVNKNKTSTQKVEETRGDTGHTRTRNRKRTS